MAVDLRYVDPRLSGVSSTAEDGAMVQDVWLALRVHALVSPLLFQLQGWLHVVRVYAAHSAHLAQLTLFALLAHL